MDLELEIFLIRNFAVRHTHQHLPTEKITDGQSQRVFAPALSPWRTCHPDFAETNRATVFLCGAEVVQLKKDLLGSEAMTCYVQTVMDDRTWIHTISHAKA